jgi:RHS repeat-associated protein
LGSASLELDENAAIISYEEYHPFGTTSYRSGRTETEISLKRYKYVGKERDEETGLYYYGFRYYAAWLCRFISVDPLQFEYPHYTPFQYAGNKPITYIDLDGLEEFNTIEKPNGSGKEGQSTATYGTKSSFIHLDGGTGVWSKTTISENWFYYSGNEGSGVNKGWKTETEYAELLLRQVRGEDIFNLDADFDDSFVGMLFQVESMEDQRKAFMRSGSIQSVPIIYDVLEFAASGGLFTIARKGSAKIVKEVGEELLEEGVETWSKRALKEGDFLIYRGSKNGKLYIGKTFDSLSQRYTKKEIGDLNATVIEKLTKIPNDGTARGVEQAIMDLNGFVAGKTNKKLNSLANIKNSTTNKFYNNAGINWLNKNIPNWKTEFKYNK